MKIILLMVSTLDGKITKWGDPKIHNWTSREDQQHFFQTLQQAKLIIMGRKTYEVAKGMMKHTPTTKRIILTSRPEKYVNETIPGQLEFSSEAPAELTKRLEQEGYTEGFLVGGASVNSKFFQAKLVTNLWLTMEPKLFGSGNSLVGEEELDIDLQLESFKKLNPNGTLLLKYQVQ
jgi:dihydrofolate reductase